MVQIVYEYIDTWPQNGEITIKSPVLEGKIAISPDSARRRVNGYLARYVALAMEAGEPQLMWGARPVWRMPVYLTLRGVGQAAKLGEMAVDAMTREILPLTAEQIVEMQNRADTIASRFTSSTTGTG